MQSQMVHKQNIKKNITHFCYISLYYLIIVFTNSIIRCKYFAIFRNLAIAPHLAPDTEIFLPHIGPYPEMHI